jgi:hypothetical protein
MMVYKPSGLGKIGGPSIVKPGAKLPTPKTDIGAGIGSKLATVAMKAFAAKKAKKRASPEQKKIMAQYAMKPRIKPTGI